MRYPTTILTEELLRDFVDKYSHASVSTLNKEESLLRIFHKQGNSVLYFSKAVKDPFLRTFKRLARLYLGKIAFFVVKRADKYSTEIYEWIGLPPS